MTRICHMTSAHPVKDIRIYYKECRSLMESGYVVYLLAQNKDSVILDGINLVSLPPSKNRFLRIFLYPWIIFFKCLRINALVYHFHDPELIFIGLLLKIFGKKVIYDVHENVPLQFSTKLYLSKSVRLILGKTIKLIEEMAVGIFDWTIVATPSIKNRFPERYQYKITVVGNYVDTNDIQPKSFSDKTDSICYMGAISYNKGIDMLVKCVEDTPIKLNLAGKFHDEVYMKKVQKMKGWENVNYFGLIERERVKELYDQSMVGMLILRPRDAFQDAMPNKLFEYLAAGLPVIASDFPLWKKIIEENNCGICVNPLDLEDIRNSIQQLVNNRTLSEEMGRNGRKLVLEKYNWKGEEKNLMNLYKKILSG